MARYTWALCLGLLLGGCVSTQRPGAASMDALNQSLVGRVVILAHQDPRIYDVVTNAEVVRTDSGLVVTSAASPPVRLDALRTISDRPDGVCTRGAAVGGLLGATPGLLVVALASAAQTVSESTDGETSDRFRSAAVGLALVGVAAAVGGAVYGSRAGRRERACPRRVLYDAARSPL